MKEIEIGSTKKIHCNTCKTETHHQLFATYPRLYKNQVGIIFEFKYRIWTCKGCDTAVLEEMYMRYLPYSGIPKKGSWEEVLSKKNASWKSNLYPKRKISNLESKSFNFLADNLKQLYQEVVESFNNDSRILCTIGLRALLEGICADKGVKVDRSLPKSIDGLKKYLSSNIVKNLHGFRFMGNVAAHELEPPDRFTLRLAIEIMEDVLNSLYELEYKSQFLSNFSTQKNKN